MKLSEAAMLVFDSAGVTQAILQDCHTMHREELGKSQAAGNKTILLHTYRVCIWSEKGKFGEAEDAALNKALTGAFNAAKLPLPEWLNDYVKSATKV